MTNIARTYLTVNDALPDLARHVLDGDELGSRKGERVLERLHQQVTLTEPWDRYPRLGLRKASLPAQIAETMWVLAGRNDVEWLSYYLPRAAEFSDDGETWRGGYGPRIRSFGGNAVDQLEAVVRELRANPTSRRAVIGIWDADLDTRPVDTEPWKDVPCNDFISFQSRLGELHAHVFVRSNDLMWGWSGINAFEWSVLQEVVASILGIEVGTLTFSISSLHAYDRHWGKLRRIAEAYPEPEAHLDPLEAFDVPRMTRDHLRPHTVGDLDLELESWFEQEAMIRSAQSFDEAWTAAHSAATSELFTSFLQVLAAARFNCPEVLDSRVLRESLKASPVAPYAVKEDRDEVKTFGGRVLRSDVTLTPAEREDKEETFDEFVESVVELHNTKHHAYGDSWKRRGESLAILANIARKVDRLGASDEYETAMDTAVDLLVYLAKYETWLTDVIRQTENASDRTIVSNDIIRRNLRYASQRRGGDRAGLEARLVDRLNKTALSDGWLDHRYIDRALSIAESVVFAAQYVVALREEAGR